MKIQNKLFFAFGVLVLMLVFLSVYSGVQLYRIDNENSDLITTSIGRRDNLAKAIASMNQLYFMNLSKAYLVATDADADEISSLQMIYNNNVISLMLHLNNYRNSITNDKYLNQTEHESRIKIVDEVLDLFNKYRIEVEELDIALHTNLQEVYRSIGNSMITGDQITERLDLLYDMVSNTVEERSSDIADDAHKTIVFMSGMALFFIVISVFVSLLMTNNIKTPITKIENAMMEISRGNLNYPIHSNKKDEISLLANQIGEMVDSISEMNKTMVVMANLDSMINVIDLDYNIIYINESLALAYGVDTKNCKGKKCYKTIRNYDEPCSFCQMAKFLPEKETYPTSEYEFVYDDVLGEWIGGKTAIIQWVDGSLAYLQSLRIETEKKKYREKLSEALEQAKAASDAKSIFLANMSHEIRTPMNAVLGMSELLLEEKMTARQLKYAEDIKMSSVALLDIINDILDASKLQAGKLKLIPVHYDFIQMINNLSSIVQYLVEEKDTGILFELIMHNQKPLYLYGDDMRLRQILLNLLSNAVKFTEKGSIKMEVNFTDTTVEFTISDTGIGIPAESIPYLYDAFEQADVIKNRSTNGTGLGLTISKALVDMMGGHISVQSVYGKGTAFYVEIPKVTGDKTLIQNNDTKETAVNAPDAAVLVVDDNETNLSVACGLLQVFNIKPDTTTSGEQAIEMVQKRQYDIVFMDHRMPGMSGAEAAKAIRNLGITIPIIALTASAVTGAKAMMLEAGMNDHLWKPIIKSELVRVLKKWIPAEKFLDLPHTVSASNESEDERYSGFWEKISQISELNMAEGINRVDGQKDVYKKTLSIMLKEIEKSDRNLQAFLNKIDMRNFCIEVHGIKGSLANIGANGLSVNAYALEQMSNQGDQNFCAENLPRFLTELNNFSNKLKDAFLEISQSSGPVEIPPELQHIFKQLTAAIEKTDFLRIDKEVEKLNALKLDGILFEEIDKIKDAVMMMEYADAKELMQKLLERV